MPTAPLRSTTPTIDVYVKLAQYPVLCDRIRLRMREELFQRGVISQQAFEQEVKDIAVESQRREGVNNPLNQEDDAVWQQRLDTIREFHTDAYFANNLGSSLLEHLIEEVLSNHQTPAQATELTFNPEIAPWTLLFKQGEIYDALPPPEKEKVKHHLAEIKVVLIKRLLSDQLRFIGVAKNIFSVRDLRWIYERLIGRGKIGGKASGMFLAWKILEKNMPDLGPAIGRHVSIPESYFVGSEIVYEFIFHNKLERFVNQKYLPLEEMRTEYPKIVKACLNGEIPVYIVEQLRDVLARIGSRPFIVRSSSLLEDHLDLPFAGKYTSYFCPNQGREIENLDALLNAVRRVYASTFNPEAMVERQKYGLIDYDERMAIMIQPLAGKRYGRYFFPPIIGSGFSQNPWHRETNTLPEDGCLRLIWGLGDGANSQRQLEESSIIPLSRSHSHQVIPALQKQAKVIVLEKNQCQMLPVQTILDEVYPHLTETTGAPETAVIPSHTFDHLTKDPKFMKLMRMALTRLEKVYDVPVEIEFTLEANPTTYGQEYLLYILQCHTHC